MPDGVGEGVAASRHVGIPLGSNPPVQRMIAVYALVWLAAGIAPWDRSAWLLENVLVVLLAGAFAATHRRFVFSKLSSGLIVAFLMLHVIGSHYTYSLVPAGEWVRDTAGLARNPYDRFVHFAFGLLFGYPLREITLRVTHVHGGWSYALPVLTVLALSSFYEILESWAARIVDPAVGIMFIGAQGDIWDGQKDMTLAMLGAILAMMAAAVWRRRCGHEAYLLR